VTPVVGVVAMLAITTVLAGIAGAALLDTAATPTAGPSAALSLSATGDRVSLTHRGGDVLDVRSLRLRVAVDGTPLDRQPPVPFFAAAGFEPGPRGPFNAATDAEWSAGETGSFAVAGTNRPTLDPGDRLSVTVYADDRPVARLSTTVSSPA
jgi:FlaG/FlaF family flagellin (archaellin)